MRMGGAVAIGFAACVFTSCANRTEIDAGIASAIDQTKAIDNHAHPMRLTDPGERDTDYDVLPVELMDPSWSIPPRANPNNPDYGRAQQALFGIREPAERVAAAKQAAMREHGDAYPDWILDRLGIDIMFANRAAMGRGLDPARFKWVPFADPLMYPLNNDRLGARDPDRKNFFSAERNTLDRYLKEAGASTLPARFDDYLSFVDATLARWKRSGAVAVKFEMAYLRSLAVGNPDRATAAKAYTSYLRSGIPPDAEYKTLQDYIFRYIALECGNLNLAVHIHSLAGAGAYYDNAGANPSNLEPALNEVRHHPRRVAVHRGNGRPAAKTERLSRLFGANLFFVSARIEPHLAVVSGDGSRSRTVRHRRQSIHGGDQLGRERLVLGADGARRAPAGAGRHGQRRGDHARARDPGCAHGAARQREEAVRVLIASSRHPSRRDWGCDPVFARDGVSPAGRSVGAIRSGAADPVRAVAADCIDRTRSVRDRRRRTAGATDRPSPVIR